MITYAITPVTSTPPSSMRVTAASAAIGDIAPPIRPVNPDGSEPPIRNSNKPAAKNNSSTITVNAIAWKVRSRHKPIIVPIDPASKMVAVVTAVSKPIWIGATPPINGKPINTGNAANIIDNGNKIDEANFPTTNSPPVKRVINSRINVRRSFSAATALAETAAANADKTINCSGASRPNIHRPKRAESDAVPSVREPSNSKYPTHNSNKIAKT